MPEGIYVSILLPAFQVRHENQIDKLLKQTLCISSQSYELFEIPSKIGKELIGSSQAFNLQDLEKLMEDNRSLQASYQKCKESLQALNCELEKIMNDPQALSETDKLKHQKLTTKYKQVNDENKRLRQHLKQLNEDFCKQRVETQTTFDSLREEIDLLVKELAPFQQQKKQNDILISN
ncbi:unnamed protein product (macronuclear) [Paramecium tetraurelia]|uniref:Uncharacterized protein n=1 Tax=Paramecium tetraurelia TaxID=5888 RepID=A0C0R5_PARTE|nr:uncharacterized protein GSPATT00033858001 [Paramecium tetraurelia]CAK64382.1 unnamed protein product [Paramecium tetraurelia]|eukprot:XP_001431780.1 hypothetical protein (macronuclear) [Paramecium tetraurelia strain d4-2]